MAWGMGHGNSSLALCQLLIFLADDGALLLGLVVLGIERKIQTPHPPCPMTPDASTRGTRATHWLPHAP